MKLYYPTEFFFNNSRGDVFPLLKAFIKPSTFSDKNRVKMYGISENDFTFTSKLDEADVLILPMSWNYYRKHKLYNSVKIFVLRHSKLKILSWTSGDFGVEIFSSNNLYVIRSSGYKTKLSNNHLGKPVFISDPLKIHYSTKLLLPVQFNKTPIIGFCGQSNYGIFTFIKECSRVTIRNILTLIGLSFDSPQEILSSSFLRSSILMKIRKSGFIKNNFIERKKYRAGLAKVDELNISKTTMEFFNNIKDSHYVICCRGGGNFSARLYETIAMGRIPVFINTDCLLPYGDEWKKHVVWIEKNELKFLEKSILDFHKKFDKNSFNKYLENNRRFWLEKMTMKTYFKCILKRINK